MCARHHHSATAICLAAALALVPSPEGAIAQRGGGVSGYDDTNINGLPKYGLIQLQPAPEYDVGPNTFDVIEDSDGLLITGEGWQQGHYDAASFLYRYRPRGGSETLFTDPGAAPWVNQPEWETLKDLGAAGYVYATAQSVILAPQPDPLGSLSAVIYHIDTSGKATILDSVSRVGWDGIGATVTDDVHLCNLRDEHRLAYLTYEGWSGIDRPGQVTFWEYAVRGDTIKRIREYVWNDIPYNEVPIVAYVRDDTLYRVMISFNEGGYYLARHSLATGERIPYSTNRRRISDLSGSPGIGSASYGTDAWYRHTIALVPKEPNSLRAVATLIAVGYDGRERYRVTSPPPEGYVTGPDFANSVLDTTTGVVALVSDVRVAGTFGQRTIDDYALLVEAFDAQTGESRWRTRLSLYGVDGPDSRYLRTAGVIARPGGGFIVAADVGSPEIQPDSGLHNTYMPLFFLDSVGCFAPGCREVNAVGGGEVSFALTLAPNPVPMGVPVRVDVAGDAAANAMPRSYRLTDASGRLVAEGPVAPNGEVPTTDLASGTYYLTTLVSEAGAGGATEYLTRVLIVR